MALALRPDVVVMDIAMPLLNGIEATRQILAALPKTRVLVLSAHSDEEYVDRVTALGAAGYVLKQSSLVELASAIRTARAGKIYVSPKIHWSSRRRTGGLPGVGGGSPMPTRLSAREAEVLQLIAEGKANKQTAALLGISIKTVEKHRNGLMQKLDIHDVAGLVRYAIAVGIIEGRNRSATS
jgi:DNA-binding NarL/FixJ family response regulator